MNADPEAPADPDPRALEDRWILSRLERAVEGTRARIDAFDFSHAALDLYDFVYGELCDWYLEMVKPRLYGEDADERRAASGVLLHVLRRTLALAHPVIPFVTEEIWGYVPGAQGLLAGGRYPEPEPARVDEDAERAVGAVVEAVQALRGWRDGLGLKVGEWIPARLEADGYGPTAEHVGRLARFRFEADGGDPVASIPVPGGAVHVLASAAVDPAEAERKLAAQRARVQSEIDRAEAKLANQGFVSKAPPEVVQAERDKLERLRRELEER